MELSEMKQSLSEMSEEDLRKLLLDIRGSRRTAKAKPEKATSTRIAKPKASKEVSFDALLNGLSADQVLQLMKSLEGK